jgi:cytoskeletal protein RodZ
MADGVNYSLKGFDQYEVRLGDELRGERATFGKSLLDVQRDLKIKASYIAAIENCDLEVFSNPGFVAGYVRSYARYLNLNPDIVFERFRGESGFSNTHIDFTMHRKKSTKQVAKSFGSELDWQPGFIGQIDTGNKAILEIVSRFSPVFVVLIVLFGTSLGAISVLKEVQKLDIVAREEFPEIFTESPHQVVDLSLLKASSNIYSSEELSLPVFEPRDRALSTLKPSTLTALENKRATGPVTYSATQNGLLILGEEKLTKKYDPLKLETPEPVVRTTPNVPEVKLLAMTPAWVRIKNESGDIVFEKILEQRETYTIKKDLFKGLLRAGNAQNVYFLINEQAFGPLSLDRSVVKNVPLDPVSLQSSLMGASAVTKKFWLENEDSFLINTAGVSE